ALAQAVRGLPRPEPRDHPERRIAEGRCDQVGDEAIDLQPVWELRMRSPVVAALPAEVAAVNIEAGGHQVGTSLVKQPVRLRLPGAKARGRIKAVEDALPIEE